MTEPLTEPREMRKAINEAARYGRDLGGSPKDHVSMSSALARNVLSAADYKGYSGEDAMTMLAYHALLRCEELTRQLIHFNNLQIAPRMVSSPAAPPSPPQSAP